MSDASRIRIRRSVVTRWLGVGLAASLAVATLVLVATGRFALYVNPSSAWFAVAMAVLLLIGAAASFWLPWGAEDDHGHDHGTPHARPLAEPQHPAGPALEEASAPAVVHAHDGHSPHGHRSGLGTGLVVAGGVLATGVVAAILVVPPAALSAELAMSRDVGAPPLFAGADTVALARTGDTSKFGVGDWAGVFASATDPEAFLGDSVTLTGFSTPAADGAGFRLTRLVITHCVIDAQPASLPIATGAAPSTGQWVTVTGTIRAGADGRLTIVASDVADIAAPGDPYEY